MGTRDLTRFRKTYFTKRQKPVYLSEGSGGVEIEATSIQFTNSSLETYATQTSYISPVVIITPTDNVNTWISSLVNNGNNWTITIETSALFTGSVHIQIAEAV